MLRPHTTIAQISARDFIGTYKASKETTSSSPSGWHIGYNKAILDDPEIVGKHAGMMTHYLADSLAFILKTII
ncbi:MAG: hypothetical protein ACK53Y_16720 [bacterium]